MIAEGDTYMKYPDDETFPQLMVNYVKLDRVPKFKDGWTPVVNALRAGDYFVTSGEVLLRNWARRGFWREAKLTPPKWNGRFRRNSRSWCGATARRWTGRLLIVKEMRCRSAAASSAFPSMRPARDGFVSRLGLGRKRRVHSARTSPMTPIRYGLWKAP